MPTTTTTTTSVAGEDRAGARRLLNAVVPRALLLALVLAAFYPTLRHDFLQWDDYQAVGQHKYFNPPTLLSLRKIWTDFTLYFYVPVTYTTWWLIAHLAYTPRPAGAVTNLSATPFHAMNLIAHAANALLVYALFRRLKLSPLVAWFGAALFAVHPIQVEAVAWVSTLYTSYSVFFALLALMLYLRFSDDQISPLPVASGGKGLKHGSVYGVATVCFVLSLLTKPSLASLPLIIAALEVGVRGRRAIWQLQPLLPWLILAVAVMAVTREAQHAGDVYSPLWLRPFVAADAVAFYLWKFFAPVALEPVYARTPAWLEQSGWVLRLTWIAPAAIVVTAIVLRRRAAWFTTAVVIFFATLIPNLGLVCFNFQRYSTVADRYCYSAMVVLAWLFASALQRVPKRVGIPLTGAVVLALACASNLQVRKWKDNQTLFGNPRGPDMSRVLIAPNTHA